MKTLIPIVIWLFSAAALTAAPVINPVANSSVNANKTTVPADTAYHEVDRGPNHKVWQRETYAQRPDGQIVTNLHAYTELATGLHYQNAQGQWLESQELIESVPGGAVARHGQHQVIFANNLNSAGAIDMQTPDGKRLRSNILGLGYYDSATGQSVLIAQIQDSPGQLIAANQVLYPNAFAGVKADVRYTYKKGSFEQDVILREQPPTPEAFGLSSATTELEVLTEFINPPAATLKEYPGQNNRQAEQDISWGAMQLGHGKAFDLGEPKAFRNHISAQKRYETVNGRNILLEMAPVRTIQPNLNQLPLQSSTKTKLPVLASKARLLPPTPLAKADEKAIKPIKLAAAVPAEKGYVMDYVVEIEDGPTDFTFRGDTTYYTTSGFYVGGTATFEGGTVIKSGAGVLLTCNHIISATTGNHPAIFTSVNDDSVGETVPVSSGTPVQGDAGILLTYSNCPRHARFAYLYVGLYMYGDSDVWDCQFMNCWQALDDSNPDSYAGIGLVKLHNVLFAGCDGDVGQDSGVPISIQGEQVTCDGGIFGWDIFAYGGGNPDTGGLTNSIFTGVGGSTNSLVFCNTFVTNSSVGVYQTFGTEHYYLPANSPLINAGSTTANLIGLYHYTTQTNQVKEGNSTVDLGYHYLALAANGQPIDSNGDGTPDYLQDANGNGLVDNGETDWRGRPLVSPPASQLVVLGSNAAFSVTADGMPLLHYQWYSNSVALSGATAATLTLNNVATNCAGNYYVVVTNSFGSVTSAPAALTVITRPVILASPASQTAFVADTVQLSVTAIGVAPLTYQWQWQGVNLTGATNATLTLPTIQLSQSGNYQVVVSNTYGTTKSLLAAVRVWSPGIVQKVAASQVADQFNQTITNLTKVVAITSGNMNGTNLALKADGTVVAWSVNLANTNLNLSANIVNTGLSNAVAIAQGSYAYSGNWIACYALKADGTVWRAYSGFGAADWQDMGYQNVNAIAANGGNFMPLFNDGTTAFSVPNYDFSSVTNFSVTNVLEVACSADSWLVLKQNGTLQAWGGSSDSYHQYTVTDVYGETAIPAALTNTPGAVIGIAAGNYHFLALKSRG